MNDSFKGPVCNGQNIFNIVLLTYLTWADIVDFRLVMSDNVLPSNHCSD